MYTYSCSQCDDFFEIRHGMTEHIDECIVCKSDKIKKVPSIPLLLKKQLSEKKGASGEVTRKFIEDSRKELKNEKKSLKEEVYEGE